MSPANFCRQCPQCFVFPTGRIEISHCVRITPRNPLHQFGRLLNPIREGRLYPVNDFHKIFEQLISIKPLAILAHVVTDFPIVIVRSLFDLRTMNDVETIPFRMFFRTMCFFQTQRFPPSTSQIYLCPLSAETGTFPTIFDLDSDPIEKCTLRRSI